MRNRSKEAPIENVPESKKEVGVSRREFLRKTAILGVGALLFELLHPSKIPAEEKKEKRVESEVSPEKEKEIIEAVSAKLEVLEKAITEQGENFVSEHESIRALQVGKPYESGLLAWFTVFNEMRHLGLEEWVKVENKDNEFKIRQWRYRFGKPEGSQYSLGHWTWSEAMGHGRSAIYQTYEEPLDPNQEESLKRLSVALDLLLKKFGHPAPENQQPLSL